MDASKVQRADRETTPYMGSNKRRVPVPPYLLALVVLLVTGAATLSVGVLHKMREHRVISILLRERDRQLISLQLLLEKEMEGNKLMRRKVDQLEAKTSILSIERAELRNKLMDSETTTTYLTDTQKELEAVLVEKESRIDQMGESSAASTPDQTTSIKELLQQKEAEGSETSSDSVPVTAEEENSNTTTASESHHHQDESVVVGAKNENATSDTVTMLDKSEYFNGSVATPAKEQNSDNTTTASGSNNQDRSTVGGTNNNHSVNETDVPGKYENSNDSIPTPSEEQHSYNATVLESSQRDDISTENQFLGLKTNMEDGRLQEKKVDGNEHSDDDPDGSHSSNKSELVQLSQKLSTDSREGSKEQPDGTRRTEDPQEEVSSHGRDSKLLEMEDGNVVVKESEKEVNDEGKPDTSEDRLSEANQNTTQDVEPLHVPTDANSSMSTNDDERKETSKRHRRRFRSRRKKRTTVAASNNDGSHQMEIDAAGNT